MNAVKIKTINPPFEVDTQYGKRTKRTFIVQDNSDPSNTFEVSHFLRRDDPELKVGDECLMELEKQGKYINCRRIELFTPPPKVEKETEEGNNNKMWAEKEMRDYRGRAIMYALETIKMSNLETKKMPPDELRNLIKMEATDYIDWIYAGVPF